MRYWPRSRLLVASAFIACGWSVACGTAFAAEELDQSSEFASSIAYPVADYQDVGQSFTVGITGKLSRIEVLLAKALSPPGDVTLTAYSTSNGVPATALGSASVPASAVSATTPTYVSFDVSSFQIPVQTDDVMAFALSNPGSGLFLMPYESMPSHYGGGNGMYRFTSGSAWEPQPTFDYGFRTYVLVEENTELFGDYNGNEVVDTDDYTVWRDLLDTTETPLPNDPTPGTTDGTDYDYWKAHFGDTPEVGDGGVAANVPEPSATAISITGLAALALANRRRRQPNHGG
jgi:hypothetical protein